MWPNPQFFEIESAVNFVSLKPFKHIALAKIFTHLIFLVITETVVRRCSSILKLSKYLQEKTCVEVCKYCEI